MIGEAEDFRRLALVELRLFQGALQQPDFEVADGLGEGQVDGCLDSRRRLFFFAAGAFSFGLGRVRRAEGLEVDLVDFR